MEPHAVLDAIQRARPRAFTPAARLCILCGAELPKTIALTLNKCDSCRNAL